MTDLRARSAGAPPDLRRLRADGPARPERVPLPLAQRIGRASRTATTSSAHRADRRAARHVVGEKPAVRRAPRATRFNDLRRQALVRRAPALPLRRVPLADRRVPPRPADSHWGRACSRTTAITRRCSATTSAARSSSGCCTPRPPLGKGTPLHRGRRGRSRVRGQHGRRLVEDQPTRPSRPSVAAISIARTGLRARLLRGHTATSSATVTHGRSHPLRREPHVGVLDLAGKFNAARCLARARTLYGQMEAALVLGSHELPAHELREPARRTHRPSQTSACSPSAPAATLGVRARQTERQGAVGGPRRELEAGYASGDADPSTGRRGASRSITSHNVGLDPVQPGDRLEDGPGRDHRPGPAHRERASERRRAALATRAAGSSAPRT
jgi:hypothetical protein